MTAVFLEIEMWAFDLAKSGLEPFPADVAATDMILDSRMRMLRARSKSLLRRVLARRLSAAPETLLFRFSPSGKPRVEGCEFSISHSGGWLVVAVGGVPLGVDVETHRPRRDPLELASRFFDPADVVPLRECVESLRRAAFIRQWVAKEAALKAAGTGIAGHLHKARCVFGGAGIRGVECEV